MSRRPRALDVADAPPAIEVVYRRPEALNPYPDNPRTHNPEQIEQLHASYREFGWTVPILIDEADTVLAGHGRREMAIQHLPGVQVPCIVKSGLTNEQKRAYVILDNKLSENSDWDMALLNREITLLQAASYDIGILGFSDVDLLSLSSPMDDLAFPAGAPVSNEEGETPSGGPRRRGRPIESSTEPTILQPGEEEPPAERGAPSAEVAASLVPFSVMMQADIRERVFGVLNQIKDRDGCTTAQALLTVVEAYEDADDDAEGEDA